MDPSSSSVGFPLSGNPQSPENSPPPHPASVGIPGSENLQSNGDLPPLHPSSLPVGSPHPETPQSIETPLNQCNGTPTLIASDEEWNVELGKLFPDLNFCRYMRLGVCDLPFEHWFGCIYGAIHFGGDTANCSKLAGNLRDCIFENVDYYKPLLTHLSEITRQ